MDIGTYLNDRPAWADVFTKDGWAKASEQQRMDAYQALEHDMAAMEGRPERQIEFDINGPEYKNSNGCFSPNDNCIHLNSDKFLSNNADYYQGMCTTMHEGRHAYQHDCNRGIVQHPDADYQANARGIRLSGEMPGVYQSTKNGATYNDYYMQANELDARKFELDQMKSLNGLYGNDPDFQDFCDQKQTTMDAEFQTAEQQARAMRTDSLNNVRDKLNAYNDADMFSKGPALQEYNDALNNANAISRCFDENDNFLPDVYGNLIPENAAAEMYTPEEINGQLSSLQQGNPSQVSSLSFGDSQGEEPIFSNQTSENRPSTEPLGDPQEPPGNNTFANSSAEPAVNDPEDASQNPQDQINDPQNREELPEEGEEQPDEGQEEPEEGEEQPDEGQEEPEEGEEQPDEGQEEPEEGEEQPDEGLEEPEEGEDLNEGYQPPG